MTRQCTICGKTYPLNRKYFTYGSNCINNISHVCKICSNKQKYEWKKKNKKPKPQKQPKVDYRNKFVLMSARIIRNGLLKRIHRLNLVYDDIFTVDFLYNYLFLCNLKCQCCNENFDFSKKSYANNKSATLDRIIPSKGYIKNNIAMICWKCNVVKSNASLEELENLLNWMKNEHLQNS